jgi:hypothetical protein
LIGSAAKNKISGSRIDKPHSQARATSDRFCCMSDPTAAALEIEAARERSRLRGEEGRGGGQRCNAYVVDLEEGAVSDVCLPACLLAGEVLSPKCLECLEVLGVEAQLQFLTKLAPPPNPQPPQLVQTTFP